MQSCNEYDRSSRVNRVKKSFNVRSLNLRDDRVIREQCREFVIGMNEVHMIKRTLTRNIVGMDSAFTPNAAKRSLSGAHSYIKCVQLLFNVGGPTKVGTP